MSASKKRVRFSEEHQVREFEIEAEEPEAPAAKRAAKLDPMEALEGEISACGLGSGGAALEAAQAASIRAACRRSQLLAGFEAGPGGLEAGADDAEEGEELYEDPDEMFDSVTGVPIEPFHLKREREEGYFDEDGNYVELKEAVEDAWADSLANVEVDEAWLARVMGGRGRREEEAAAGTGAAPEMSSEEVAARKRSLLDLLLPGENVLQALRRLAAVRQPAASPTTGAAEPPSGRASPASSDPLSRHPRALRVHGGMPTAVRERFEALTALSAELMHAGVFGVHTMSREQLERSLGGPEAGPGSTGGAASGGAGDAAEQLAEQLLAAAGGGGAPKVGANGSSGGGGGGEASEGAAAAARQAADPEEDLFAEDPMPAGSRPGSAAGEAASSERTESLLQPQAPGAASGGLLRDASGDVTMNDLQQQQSADQEQLQQAQQAQSQQQPPQQQAAPAGLAAAAGGLAGGGQLDGFSLDPSTGLLYNSELGAYYDAQRELFGDAASGQWFRLDAATGAFTPAEL